MSAYVKQEWKDLPDQTTPITAERLNHMEDGISAAVTLEDLDGLIASLIVDPGSETYLAIQSLLEG